MIVYRELSSLETDLGYPAKRMYSLSNSVYRHYHKASIPKGNGEYRELYVPDEELKALQKRITDIILARVEISPYAMAYRIGASPLKNAAPHVGHQILLKLDIRHFFDNITYYLVKEKAFPGNIFSESNRILLATLCCYDDCLPQGAPSSPAISNIILREFDNVIGAWCDARNITYTRYCDDLTFSGNFDPSAVKRIVSDELRRMGFFLNEKKTVCVRDGQKMSVTGIVVNHKANVSSSYRKNIRQEIYYCQKYGVRDHLKTKKTEESEADFLRKLLGRVNYVLSVDPANAEFIRYKDWITGKLSSIPTTTKRKNRDCRKYIVMCLPK